MPDRVPVEVEAQEVVAEMLRDQGLEFPTRRDYELAEAIVGSLNDRGLLVRRDEGLTPEEAEAICEPEPWALKNQARSTGLAKLRRLAGQSRVE